MTTKGRRSKITLLWSIATWAFVLIVGLVLLLRTGSPLSLILVAAGVITLAVVFRQYRLEKNR